MSLNQQLCVNSNSWNELCEMSHTLTGTMFHKTEVDAEYNI